MHRCDACEMEEEERALERFAGSLFCRDCSILGPRLARVFDEYREQHRLDEQTTITRQEVVVALPIALTVRVERERPHHLLRRALRVSGELEVGEDWFDSRAWITSDSEATARALLDVDEVRLPMLVLLDHGLHIEVSSRALVVEGPRPPDLRERDLAFCALVVQVERRARVVAQRASAGPYR